MKKILIVCLTAAIITLLMPSGGMVSLEATPGEVWDEATLVAPFDIPISRSATQISEEKQKVQQSLRPAFTLDTLNYRRLLTQMSAALEASGIAPAQRDTAVSLAKRAYETGIISLGEANSYFDRAIFIHYGGSQALHTEHSSRFGTPQQTIEFIAERSALSPDIIAPYIAVNLTYDERLTNAIRDKAFADVSTTEGVVRRGETVITRGQVVDQPMMRTLASLRSELETRLGEGSSQYAVTIGRLIIILTIFLLNYLFFTRFAVNYFGGGIREMAFVMTTYLIIVSLVAICANIGISAYIVPLPIVAIYLLTFFNMRVAIFGNATIALLCAMFVKQPFDFFVINFISGMMAIYVMRHFYHRGKLMRALGAILLTQIVVFSGLILMREGSLSAIGYRGFIWFAVSGLLFLGFYQMLYLVERLFSFVSDITLLELCDTNQPLLMQLAQSAPGTFQHSVQVANLAESAAKEIGANPLLARTGAMYHDIGKMENPFYFVENLSGTFNPHDDCSIDQSVDIIKAHISDGMNIARKNKLPASVMEFIERHHGESLIYYFYNKAKKERGDDEVREADFRYPGPLPVSKEVSICMMADAVEAASRSLPSYDKEPLEALVDSVVDVQIRSGQFAASQLTFEEIRRVKDVLKAKLNNIYHGRIAYPVRTVPSEGDIPAEGAF